MQAFEDGRDAFFPSQGFELGAQGEVRGDARRLPAFEEGPDVLAAAAAEHRQLVTGPHVIQGCLRGVKVASEGPGIGRVSHVYEMVGDPGARGRVYLRGA